jgi:hypothetical protein
VPSSKVTDSPRSRVSYVKARRLSNALFKVTESA